MGTEKAAEVSPGGPTDEASPDWLTRAVSPPIQEHNVNPNEGILRRMRARQAELGLSLYQLDIEVGGRWPRRLIKGQVEITGANVHALAELLSTHPANLLREVVPPLEPLDPHPPWLAVWRPAQARLRAARLSLGLSVPEWGRRAGLEGMTEAGLRRLEYETRGQFPWSRWVAMCAAAQVDPVSILYPETYPRA